VKKPEDQKGFQVIPQRWKAERTIAWLNRNRRLSKDYEYYTENSESMVYRPVGHLRLASIRLMLRRLANAET
jgi:putative transposase